MKRIVVLISGRGSNLAAILAARAAEFWPARIAAVISHRPDAGGLAVAQAHGIPTMVVDHRRFASRIDFDAELANAIDGFGPDLVVLAGFMRILGDAFVQRFEGRMMNIHPSLLPAFTGLHTHQRALDAGCKLAGATVHFVTEELDHGAIVAQAVVPVLADDNEARLSARVLAAEHVLYPCALRWWAHGLLQIEGGLVRHLGGESQLLTGPF